MASFPLTKFVVKPVAVIVYRQCVQRTSNANPGLVRHLFRKIPFQCDADLHNSSHSRCSTIAYEPAYSLPLFPKNAEAIMHDKSNLFALHCLLAFIGPGEEVMLVNHPNSLNGIHLEGLLMNKFPTVTPVPTIRVVRQPKENEDPRLIPKCGCRTTRMITDDFLTLNPGGETYRGLRHIVLESLDMKTGVVNPIDYIDCENEVNQVRTVIFVSHSVDVDETETAVQRCVEYANRTLQREMEANATPSRPATSTPGFVCRVPPGIPALAEAEAAIAAGEAGPNLITPSQCIHFAPSNLHNGFFIACIKKELLLVTQPEAPAEDDEENPDDIAANVNKKRRGDNNSTGSPLAKKYKVTIFTQFLEGSVSLVHPIQLQFQLLNYSQCQAMSMANTRAVIGGGGGTIEADDKLPRRITSKPGCRGKGTVSSWTLDEEVGVGVFSPLSMALRLNSSLNCSCV
ncbi:unnamed protein product [Hydatigera taeniaeformis]|uniref:Uncharacterized protein n=1 Tax=Hydatigena taeniaeformis TaxID=6205 RepID=A0A0R3WL30_HYDTA|nr:unnamed protein product [Hydatigera taeniaeformis]